MTPSDRELLALAAKAAGIEWPQCITDAQMQIEGARQWNPLRNDGDALRLAVKLNLKIEIDSHKGVYPSTHILSFTRPDSINPLHVGITETHEDDAFAATRRAIVRAAAEIGRTL